MRVSDCADLSLINTLDGFNTQPRISIPFTGDIDPATITTDTVYLLQVGDAQTGAARGQRVGINQATWDSATKTIFVESDQLLAEHARYLLVVTDGIRDLQGRRLSRGAWQYCLSVAGKWFIPLLKMMLYRLKGYPNVKL